MDITSPSGTIVRIEGNPLLLDFCPPAVIDIGTLDRSGITKSARLNANISSWDGGQTVTVGVYIIIGGITFHLFGIRIAELVINQNTIEFESPVPLYRFGSNDTIGVFLDRSFCEGAVTITNPRVNIQYASLDSD